MANPGKPESYRGDDPFAFVAYSHGDNELVYAEINRITELGFRVYYDDGIHPGHRWREDIAEAIDRAALFIFFISPRSIASEDCLRELSYALYTASQAGVDIALADFGLYGTSDGWRGVDRWIDLSTSETIWR